MSFKDNNTPIVRVQGSMVHIEFSLPDETAFNQLPLSKSGKTRLFTQLTAPIPGTPARMTLSAYVPADATE
jgi:hypothetical protein